MRCWQLCQLWMAIRMRFLAIYLFEKQHQVKTYISRDIITQKATFLATKVAENAERQRVCYALCARDDIAAEIAATHIRDEAT